MNSNEVKKITIETQKYLDDWLRQSKITEDDLKSIAEKKYIQIKIIKDHKYICSLYGSEGPIGLPFLSDGKKDNDFMFTLSLILVRLANILDMLYIKNDVSERSKYGCNYYFEKVRKFINSNVNYK